MKNTKFLRIYLLVLLAVTLIGCQSGNNVKPNATQEVKNIPKTSEIQQLKTEEVMNAFNKANLPIEKEVLFTEEDDPNKLLGRPNQYSGKASWNDKRVKALTPEQRDMTIEVFTSDDDWKVVENMWKR